jgi:hypothetical protein
VVGDWHQDNRSGAVTALYPEGSPKATALGLLLVEAPFRLEALMDTSPSVEQQSTERQYDRWHESIPDRIPVISEKLDGAVLISEILPDWHNHFLCTVESCPSGDRTPIVY